MNTTHTCEFCKRSFKSQRQFTTHYDACKKDQEYFIPTNNNDHSNVSENMDKDDIVIDDISSPTSFVDCSQTTQVNNIPDYLYPVDNSLMNQFENHQQSKIEQLSNENQYLNAAVELMIILEDCNAPLKVFDDLMNWAVSCNEKEVYFDKKTKMTREKVVKDLTRKYDATGMVPKETMLTLTSTKEQVPISHSNFQQCLYSLLTDKDLMEPENLLMDTPVESNMYDDVNSGIVHETALRNYITDVSKEKLIEIIFFIDETHTDIHGRLKLEPLLFTLSIFNRKTRKNPRAWRALGFVTNLIEKAGTPEDRMRDYHNSLKIILQSYKEAQVTRPLWKFADGIKSIIMPTMFIMGDTKGQDKLCGKFGSSNTDRLCRICNIPKDKIDSYEKAYARTQWTTIQNHIRRGNHNVLKTMSIHPIKNAWHDIFFSDSLYGIHGAVPAEVLHAIQLGLHQYLLEALFEQKKEAPKKRKNSRTNDTEQNTPNSTPVANKRRATPQQRGRNTNTPGSAPCNNPTLDDEFSSRHVFSENYANKFNSICAKYGKLLSQQSDDDLPRTHFSTNYTNIAKKNGHEMQGLLIVILIVLSSDEGKSFDVSLGGNRCSAFVHGLELMVMMEQFVWSEKISKQENDIFGEGVEFIMETFKKIIDRRHGNGCKFIKFHLPSHFSMFIEQFGSMENVNSCVGEMLHKTEIKKSAQTTQRRKQNFERQSFSRYFEHVLCQQSKKLKLGAPDVNMEEVKVESKMFYDIDKNEFYKVNSTTKKEEISNWEDTYLKTKIALIFNKMVEDKCISNSILPFYTYLKVGNMKIRADPNFQNKGPIYNWVNVKMKNKDGIEHETCAKCLIIVDLRKHFKKTFQWGETCVDSEGYYVLAYFMEVPPESNQGCFICDFGELACERKNTKQFRIGFFKFTQLIRPCIAVPYKTRDSVCDAKEWNILKPRNTWKKILIDHLKKNIQECNEKKNQGIVQC